MSIDKSIDFLLENGSHIIKYRLHKEILHDINKNEEENLLEKVFDSPKFKLVEGYQKENGYIGIGMHSGDKFKETALQDGEVATRLLSNYGIPKDSLIIKRFIDALTDDEVLEHEFSYHRPEITRFKERYLGNEAGWGLQLLIDTVIALLGYGDRYCQRMINISLAAFTSIESRTSIMDIATFKQNAKRKYNYPYLEIGQQWPCMYHLETLSHTSLWRNEASKKQLAEAINHLIEITPEKNPYYIKLGNRYYAPCGGFSMPIKPYGDWRKQLVCNRRVLTDITRCGIGEMVTVTKQTAETLQEELHKNDGLRVKFESNYEKSKFKLSLMYPGPYCELGLADDYKSDHAITCDLTFWAIHFLNEYNYFKSCKIT